MPDWSYHVLFKPWLTKLSTTASRAFIHKNMKRIASFPGGSSLIHFLGREENSRYLHRNIDNKVFCGCTGLSGKIDPQLNGTKAFSQLGFSLIEVGPVTLQPETSPVYPERVPPSGTIRFSEKGEKVGLKETIYRLKQANIHTPLLFHLDGSKEEILEMSEALHPFDGFLSISYQTMIDKLNRDDLRALSGKKSLYIRVPSRKVVSLDEGLPYISGVVLEEESGEETGKNKHHHLTALENYQDLHKITVGGVREPADALELLNHGADLILLSGEYVEAGPGLPKRINEALLDEIEQPDIRETGWLWYFLFGMAVLVGGVLALLFSLTSVILPYDEHFLGMSREELLLFNERILWFMAHDRMTLAGTMISGGILYMALARLGVKKGLKWAKQAIDVAAITGFLGILFFIGYGYFDWLHLLFWLVLLPFYLTGFVKSRALRETPTSKNRTNSQIWKKGIYGQFCFVVLGFAFVLGGIVISAVGVTGVFIPTDVEYLCMPPELIQSFNERLIPVIAHDRAGFGSALFSVGALVLMCGLWGFQQGNRWLWWTFLIGGLPAFIAGIFVHIMIGYTTFIHLLPAYVALGFYINGLWLSFSFLVKR